MTLSANGGYDVTRVRQDFPILSRQVNGYPLVYLDNGATAQTPSVVIDALVDYYQTLNANVHRGVHTLSIEATDAMEAARETVRRFIGAGSVREVIFTRGTTESINLVAQAWGRANLRAGDEILISALEHHSNIVPWQQAAAASGARLVVIPIDDAGQLTVAAVEAAITPRTRLVAFTAMSNVLGSITPVAEICALARQRGIVSLIDGAQSVPHLPVDVRALGCDFLAFSGHKLPGPTGIGALFGREALLTAMEPWQGGGDMIRTVSFEASTWNELPWKFEAGTPDIAGAIALGTAIEYLEALGMGAIREHEIAVTGYALQRLKAMPGLRVPGPPAAEDRGGVVSFLVDGVHPHDVGTILDQQGIAIRAGHHCAMPLMGLLGVPATARASFACYTTLDEIDRLCDGVESAQRLFARAPSRV